MELLDRRITKTKNAIEKAFFQLIVKKGTKITVSEIARIADIDRKTFYLHYNSVDDIMKEFCIRKVQEFLDLMNEQRDTRTVDLHVLFGVLNHMISQNIELLQLISISEHKKYFFEQIQTILTQFVVNNYGDALPFDENELLVYSKFFISGIISTYGMWMDQKLPISDSELANMITKACVNGLEFLLQEKN